MTGDSMTKQNDWRLGNILAAHCLVSEAALEEALLITRQTELPLGSILLLTGHINERELRAIIQAQSMLKDDLVSEDLISAAMPIARHSKGSFETVLKQLKWYRDSDIKTNRLGELLLAAHLVSHIELAKGLANSRLTMLPLGRTLVMTGSLTPRVLKQALKIQEDIRHKSLSRDEGIGMLADLCQRNDVIAKETRARHPEVNLREPLVLGDLLVESGAISELEFLVALEESVQQNQRVGQWLIEKELVIGPIMKAALDLQRLVRISVVSRNQAISALHAMLETPIGLRKAIHHEMPMNSVGRTINKDAMAFMSSHLTGMSLPDLMRKMSESAERIKDAGLSQAGPAAGLLAHSGDAFSTVDEIAEQLCDYVYCGGLRVDQALVLLQICAKDQCSVPEALSKLSWIVNVPLYSTNEKTNGDEKSSPFIVQRV
jgi:hypothetical protein